MEYDILIVGAGLTGATIAALNRDKKILMLENDEVGGMCRTENYNGIDVHLHGPHIFHTNNDRVWKFINKYAEFNNYIHAAKATIGDRVLDFPINLNVYNDLYLIDSPEVASTLIQESDADNFEDYLIEKIGVDLYDMYYKGYTEKMWGMPAHHIPLFIAKRVPIRTSFNNKYFNDKYQGIPINGYTEMIEKMIEHVEIRNVDFCKRKEEFESMAEHVIYTGSIDEYFNYELGELPYRSMEYFMSIEPVKDYQGVSQMNFPDKDVHYTRIIEHKHFNWVDKDSTIIHKEYPRQWRRNSHLKRFYPIPIEENEHLYDRYLSLEHKAIFAGRLGTYKYMNMDECIEQAMIINDNFINP